jgi:predicted dehydrogenase
VSGRIKLGIVGLNFGRHIVDAVTTGRPREIIELAEVCDRDHARADAVADPLGIKTCYTLDELLANRSLDAIGVFTGPVGRAEVIRRVIRAGKHVITTKPFEVDPDAALDVLQEARSLHRAVHLNSPTPLLPGNLRQVLDWREQFDLGRPIACRRDVWASYREKADGSWMDDPETCPVAPIFRLGIYMINDLVRLFGECESVQVTQSRIFTGRPTADNAQLTMQFHSGAIATVFASFCVDDGAPYGNAMVLNYERGTIYQNVAPASSHLSGNTRAMTLVMNDGSGRPCSRHITPDDASGGYQWDAFVRAVRGERLVGEVLPQEIVAGLRVVQAMKRASVSGATERVV